MVASPWVQMTARISRSPTASSTPATSVPGSMTMTSSSSPTIQMLTSRRPSRHRPPRATRTGRSEWSSGLSFPHLADPANPPTFLTTASLGRAADEGAKRRKNPAPATEPDGAAAQTWELRGHRPDPYFTGRDDELATLHHAFRADGTTFAIQVITGLGGLGKTRLAVEYAWRYASEPTTSRGGYAPRTRPRCGATTPS